MEGAPRGERLHAGEDLLGKQADVPPRLVVGHAAIAEDPDQHAAPGEPLVLADALVDLVGRAPHLEVGEELHEAVLAVQFLADLQVWGTPDQVYERICE